MRLYVAGKSGDSWLQRPPEYRRAVKMQLLKNKDSGICKKCKKVYSHFKLSIDHIIPISRGGPVDDVSNMQLLCGKCHKKKTHREKLGKSIKRFRPHISWRKVIRREVRIGL